MAITRFIAKCIIILVLVSCTEDKPESRISFIEMTISETQDSLLNGRVSCREVVQGYLDRIAFYDKAKGINAITVLNPKALEKADAIDSIVVRGGQLPELFCTPCLLYTSPSPRDRTRSRMPSSA